MDHHLLAESTLQHLYLKASNLHEIRLKYRQISALNNFKFSATQINRDLTFKICVMSYHQQKKTEELLLVPLMIMTSHSRFIIIALFLAYVHYIGAGS